MPYLGYDVTVPANSDLDDGLRGAAHEYISKHPELKASDLGARWTDDRRETVTLQVLAWFIVRACDITASMASATTTGVEGGIDVHFTITLDGFSQDGKATLLPGKDGSYGDWGKMNQWLDARTARLFEDLDPGEWGDFFCAVLNATAPMAKRFAEGEEA
jgi:hypothetical protein